MLRPPVEIKTQSGHFAVVQYELSASDSKRTFPNGSVGMVPYCMMQLRRLRRVYALYK